LLLAAHAGQGVAPSGKAMPQSVQVHPSPSLVIARLLFGLSLGPRGRQ
jgi:hypothetical protein